MTEGDWLSKNAPKEMLNFLRPRASSRQHRHFGAAVCRLVWDLLPDGPVRAAVECVEWYAVGAATKEYLAACQSRATAAARPLLLRRDEAQRMMASLSPRQVEERALAWERYYVVARPAGAAEAVALVARPTGRIALLAESVSQALDKVFWAMLMGRVAKTLHPELSASYAAIIRDIFGNPFRPVVFDSSWRSQAAITLALGMRKSRDFSAAPALADALEAAGCADAAVLSHLRGGGVHVRGCWVCDGVLGLT